MCLLSLDAVKVFDWVHWSFLCTALEHIGIGGTLFGRIMALYSNPSAQIRLNGQLFSPFFIHNDTRPLLPPICHFYGTPGRLP